MIWGVKPSDAMDHSKINGGNRDDCSGSNSDSDAKSQIQLFISHSGFTWIKDR